MIRPIRLRIYLSPGAVLWGSAGLLLLTLTGEPGTESVTLSTYYPAPSGVYNKLITTGDTFLDRDQAGKVGIGTTSPQALLDVNGLIRLWNSNDPPDSASAPGDIYYSVSSGTFRGYYSKGGWRDLGSCGAVPSSSMTFTYVMADPLPPQVSRTANPGQYLWTVPSSVTQVWVTMVGGGGEIYYNSSSDTFRGCQNGEWGNLGQ